MSAYGDKSALQSRIALPGKAKKSLLHREGHIFISVFSFLLSAFTPSVPSP
jgi:hypothetical protein